MHYAKEISLAIKDLERSVDLYKYVQEKIPNVKVHFSKNSKKHTFFSRHVNSNYTNFEFIQSNNTVWVSPYIDLPFEYEDKTERVKIYSAPKRSKLVYTKYNYLKRKSVIAFSRLAINFKNNNFKDDMLNACRLKILDFINKYPKIELDQTHLDPKLSKLLMFI